MNTYHISGNYHILAVRKNNIMYCASYNKMSHSEIITSIETGETFHSINAFTASILGMNATNEVKDCLYYSDKRMKWRSIKRILKKR